MKIHIILWVIIALVWGMNACKSAQARVPEIATAPPTTLEKAMEVQTASAVLATEETTNILHATNNLTEDRPQFAFQIWSLKTVQELTDTPQKCLLVTHNDGSLTIFGLNGWDQVRDYNGGYDIWYKGDAVTCTIYTSSTGHVIRINTRKMRGQLEHDALAEYVLRKIPPMPVPEMGPVPIVMHDMRVSEGIVRGPIYGLETSAWDRWAKVIARAQ